MSEIELLASRASPDIGVSELHGIVCGFCISQPYGYSFEELVELCGQEQIAEPEMLEAFIQSSMEELLDENLIFSPLISEDSELLQDRVSGLADFCMGFLSGFGAGVALTRRSIPEELEEILEDFTSISALSELENEERDDEASYLELYEYAKVSVLLVHGIFIETEHAMTLDDG